jgi:hypothetical protein
MMKINTVIRPSLGGAVALVTLLAAGCYYMPGQGGGTAKVAISAKGIPANLSSVALVVTAPGMAPVTATASTTANSITVSVPAGPARTFTLLLNGPSATLEGVATVDLQAGQSTTVNVTPTLGATQLVFPDFQNSRLVQISDMNGTGWTQLYAANFSGITAFSPYAVDFDNQGKIYVANDNLGSTYGVIRIDDVNHTTGSALVVVDGVYGSGIKSVAVDRSNNLVYYIGTSPASGTPILFVKSVANILATATQINLSTLLTSAPNSMAVDDQGMLYFAIQGIPGTTFTPGYVMKYNPTTGTKVATATGFNSPFAVMVKGPYVYVSDNTDIGGTGKAQIVRLDTNLNPIDSFSGPSTDPFYGPEAFVAVLNKKFTVIDEGPTSSFKDRLASFDDMSGSNWTTLGSFGSGVNAFDFYNIC